MLFRSILGMAAHLDGKASGIIDMAGMAQKGGAVVSHVRLAARADDIHAIRIAAGEADLVLGADSVVTGGKTTLSAVRHGSTSLIVNTAEIMPGAVGRDRRAHIDDEAPFTDALNRPDKQSAALSRQIDAQVAFDSVARRGGEVRQIGRAHV